MLLDMLERRDKISSVLQEIIDERSEPWGINVVIVPSTAVESMQLWGACGTNSADHGTGSETRQRTEGSRTQERKLTMEAGVWPNCYPSAARRSIGEAWILDEEKKKIVSSSEHATGPADLPARTNFGK